MPLMLIIGYEQIQVVQCLMPLGKDKTVMINAAIGACVGIVLNLVIVPHLLCIGSAITWTAAELSILILSQIFLNKYLKLQFPFKDFFKETLTYLPLLGTLLAIYFTLNFLSYWILILIGTGVCGFYILILLLFSKRFGYMKNLLRLG